MSPHVPACGSMRQQVRSLSQPASSGSGTTLDKTLESILFSGTSLRSPLSEVRNRPCSSLFDGVPASTVKQVQGQQNPVEPPSSKPAGTSTRKRNIVTAWGNNEKSVQPSAAAQQQPGKQPGTSSLPANASTTVPGGYKFQGCSLHPSGFDRHCTSLPQCHPLVPLQRLGKHHLQPT
jgi:hypothetical protein